MFELTISDELLKTAFSKVKNLSDIKEIREKLRKEILAIFLSNNLPVEVSEVEYPVSMRYGEITYLYKGICKYIPPIFEETFKTSIEDYVDNLLGYGCYTDSLYLFQRDNRDLKSLKDILKTNFIYLGNISFKFDTHLLKFKVINKSKGFCIRAYSVRNFPKYKSTFLCLIDNFFDTKLVEDVVKSTLTKAKCKYNFLVEEAYLDWDYPVLFKCILTGEFYTCSCFKKHLWDDYENVFEYEKSRYESVLKNIKFMDKICSLCMETKPTINYAQSVYTPKLVGILAPYIKLLSFRENMSPKEAYSYLLVKFKLNKWSKENQIYEIIKKLFPDKKVILHYRGKELQGLELDIFIPELKIAVEYQGEQHFKPIDIFGGEEGLKKVKERDKRKKKICKNLGIKLVEIRFDEEINLLSIHEKIKKLTDN